MIITMKPNASPEETQRLISSIEGKGLEMHLISGTSLNVFGVVGDTTILDEKMIYGYSCVHEVTPIAAPYKLANRIFHPDDTVVQGRGACGPAGPVRARKGGGYCRALLCGGGGIIAAFG